jgi:DNA-binding PadR family transcriptional regulator
LSPGTLYPILHGLEEKGYVTSFEERDGKQSRRFYRATPRGREAMKSARTKVRELFSEIVGEDSRAATRRRAKQ